MTTLALSSPVGKTIGSNRACPGVYGMIIAEQLRSRFGLACQKINDSKIS